jgi:Interleukin-like EMT inducer
LQKRGNGWPVHALVILAYLLLTLALTWPMTAHFGSHVPGDGSDDPPLTWNLWWVPHALLDLKASPFDCNYLFYPLGINLAFYTHTVLNGVLSIPIQATVGLIPASNVLLLSSFVLSGYGAFLLALYLLRQRRRDTKEQQVNVGTYCVAFFAGLLYAFASSKLSYAALGQWDITSSQWIPFYILYLFKMADHPGRWGYVFLAALFLLFQAYAETIFASFLVLFTVLWVVWKLASGHRAWRILPPVAATGLISAVGLIPLLTAMIPDMRAEGDILMEGGGFADVFSADLLGFLIPTMHHPLFGSLVEHFSFDHTVGQHLYLGYSVLALAIVGVVWGWRRPSVKFWLLSALTFWLLTLGPSLRVNGHDTGLPLPFALVARLPFFEGNRYPSRYSVLLALSLAVLVGFGLTAILSWIGKKHASTAAGRLFRPALVILLSTLLLFEQLSVPLPLSDMRVPPVYQGIADMPGDWTLLDVPVAWRNGFRVTGTLDPIIMFEQYYQTVHGKRLLAGNISRNPPLKFQYFTEAPVVNTLIALETGHQVGAAVIEGDRALAPAVLRFFNIHSIVIHPDQAGPDAVSYIEKALPVRPIDAQDTGQTSILAYAVDLPPWPETWTATSNDPLGRLSYAEGWGATATTTVWAERSAVRLLVPAPDEEGSRQMSFRAFTPGEGQRLHLEINGQAAGQVDLRPGWQDLELALPAGSMRQGLNEVWLRFDQLYPAQQVELSSRLIGQTGVEAPVNLVIQSAGQEVGDLALIYVNGQDVSPNRRGYNVVVIHPTTGAVVEAAAFDTHLDEGASQALASFITEVPAGYLVAVAAADEASRLLGLEAVDALHTIGASSDLRDHFRWGHAIVGVKGAPPGTALEALDWIRPVTLVVGEGATEPHLAAAFPFITFGVTSVK